MSLRHSINPYSPHKSQPSPQKNLRGRAHSPRFVTNPSSTAPGWTNPASARARGRSGVSYLRLPSRWIWIVG